MGTAPAKLVFAVQGSAPRPYTLIFRRLSGHVTASCTCPLGRVHELCKHRLGILQGKTTGLVSGNEEDLEIVARWIAESRVGEAVAEVSAIEKQMEQLKHRFRILRFEIGAHIAA